MDTTLTPTLTSIDDLLTLGPNWNSYDALAPDPAAIAHAKEWVTSLHQCVQEWNLPWFAPHVCADPCDGSVVLGWINNQREVEFYVEAQAPIMVIQVENTGEQRCDSDCTVRQSGECKDIWEWLRQGASYVEGQAL